MILGSSDLIVCCKCCNQLGLEADCALGFGGWSGKQFKTSQILGHEH
uniref:Uncharacterized protein n=1 Tax=Arundo donax TaxID=35708 RepID=A0A0A9SUX8_ARUDO